LALWKDGKMKLASDIVMKLLGVVLLAAAILKGYQLLTEPMAEDTIWSQRWFLILQVEFELFLGIWLVSGIMKRAVWLAALSCFVLFSGVTLYKGISGADSCGCFGSFKVNPWLTLFAIDLPAVLGLAIFRTAGLSGQTAAQTKRRFLFLLGLFTPRPPLPRFAVGFSACLILLVVITSILAFNKPQKVTATYEVLEPETWIGKELPIIDYIDIGNQLREGNWLVLFFHHDCPDCQKALKQSESFDENNNVFKRAFVEISPFSTKKINNTVFVIHGRLSATKQWIVETPTKIYIKDNIVTKVLVGIKYS